MNVEFTGQPASKAAPYLAYGGWLAGVDARSEIVKPGSGAREFGRLHEGDDPRTPSGPAASIATFGKGRIAATYVNLGAPYLRARTATAQRFLSDLVREVFPRPGVEVRGVGRSKWC